jgi:hypothetical protein
LRRMEKCQLVNNRGTSTSDIFLKDRVKNDEIKVRYCPTEEMLADFLTKPRQGSLFHRFRDVLLGYQHVATLQSTNNSVTSPEEHVRDHKIVEEARKHEGSTVVKRVGQVNVTHELNTGETEEKRTLVMSRNKMRRSHNEVVRDKVPVDA